MEISTYETLVDHARQFYQNSAIRQEADANESFRKFIETAENADITRPAKGPIIVDFNTRKSVGGGVEIVEKYNPSLVRMALQQGYCDTLAGCLIARDSGQIDNEACEQLQRNLVKSSQRAQRSNFGLGTFADLKKAFPSSYLKRMAITQCLRDGALVMLDNEANGRTAATVKSFGEDLGLACVKDMKPEKVKIYNILRVSTVFDKILYGFVKVAKGLKNLIRR